MRFLKLNFVVGLFVVLWLLPISTVSANVSEKTEVEIEISKSSMDEDEDSGIDKETIYTPVEPTPLRVLPNTGEVIVSFIYIIIGLSIILFLFGLLVSRLIQNDVRWDYE